MSVRVDLAALADTIAERTSAPYLLTGGDNGRPHTTSIALGWEGDILVGGCGGTTARNARSRPAVSLLWPPNQPGDYSLIVDGDATVAGDGDERVIRVTPTHAILHRPATGGGGHRHDCQPISGAD